MEEYPSLAEGVGLENREASKGARGFESLLLRHINIIPSWGGARPNKLL
jgi:hypothetical protein